MLLAGLLFAFATRASAQVFEGVIVDGKSSVYAFDGKFGGSGSLLAAEFDLAMCPGREMVIKNASGKVGCCWVANNGPDGLQLDSAFDVEGINEASGWYAMRGLALVGLFRQPDSDLASTPPSHIDYRKIGFDSERYQLKLRQVFFVGDGYSQKYAKRQVFQVPDDATQLVLGIIDRTPDGKPGYYQDNVGAFRLDVVVSGCAALVS